MFLGHDGILEHVTSWANMWEDWSVEVDRFSRNEATGMELDALHAELYTVRDGQIVRWQGFSVRAEALEAAGLRE
jgi:ketosteroid isomerase-like protein